MDDSEPEEMKLILFGKMECFITFFPLDPFHRKISFFFSPFTSIYAYGTKYNTRYLTNF